MQNEKMSKHFRKQDTSCAITQAYFYLKIERSLLSRKTKAASEQVSNNTSIDT